MSRKLFVANFPFSTTADELKEFFLEQGEVLDANVVLDRESGRSRGFGFVEMDSAENAERAVEATNGSDMGGRPLTVRIAEERGRPSGPGGRPGGRGGPRGPRG